MKKAVITDYTWTDLEIEKDLLGKAGAEVTAHRIAMDDEEALIAATKDAEVVLIQNANMTRRVLEACSRCRGIVCYGVGTEAVDLAAATERGIRVANVPDYCTQEVADHAMALILSSIRQVTRETVAIKRNPKGLTYGGPLFPPMLKAREQVLGLVGFGEIPRALVRRAAPFGFTIIAHDPFAPEEIFKAHGVTGVSLDELLRISDVVSLHVPLNRKTEKMIGAAQFQRMKKTAYLVNTARGAILDEDALCEALEKGWIAGAALDVTVQEPIQAGHPLLAMDNVILTNHTGYYSEGCLEDVRRKAALEAARILRGEDPRPVAFVNPEVRKGRR